MKKAVPLLTLNPVSGKRSRAQAKALIARQHLAEKPVTATEPT